MSRRLCLVSLGSNLGDRAAALRESLARLAVLPQTSLVSQSAWHPTAPVGGPPGQDEFLNAAALLESSLPPRELLAELQTIESQLGRVPGPRWGPRAIDLDLLLYGDQLSTTPELTLPHPRLAFRRFVLAPAVEIAPDLVHPELGLTLRQLWDHLNSTPLRIALSGGTPAQRQALASLVSGQTPATVQDDWNAATPAPGSPSPPLPTPRLLVRLDDTPLAAPYKGPVLQVEARDFAGAAAEIIAAIAAMR